jgi:hypothetical protein
MFSFFKTFRASGNVAVLLLRTIFDTCGSTASTAKLQAVLRRSLPRDALAVHMIVDPSQGVAHLFQHS